VRYPPSPYLLFKVFNSGRLGSDLNRGTGPGSVPPPLLELGGVDAGMVDGAAAGARGLDRTVRHGEWSGEGLALAAGVEFLGCEGAGVDGLMDLMVLFRGHVLVPLLVMMR